ncbi:MAG TPA: universal stress protein [Pyrinomonadaceae bacterium]|nr:universal stress protein [Pyrinomonadaceae bacterium]
MITIQRILCPTDFSSESDEGLRYGVALASAYNAKLFLLYCKEVSKNGNENGVDAAGVGMASLFAASLAPNLGLTTLSELNWEGLVAEKVEDVGNTIVQEATKHKVDLIVMRSRRRPHSAVLLGSTAETVYRTSPCPVLVTHPREREWVGFSTGEIDLQQILVAYDFSSDAEVALNYGLSLAQEYQTELHLLHVLKQAEQEEPELAWVQKTDSPYTKAASRLQRAIPDEAFAWCRITNAVRWGRTYQEVLAYAKEHEIDLICLGANGRDFSLGALFGSNVDRILRQAPCPVLIARPIKSSGLEASRHSEHQLEIKNKEGVHDNIKLLHRRKQTSRERSDFVHDRTERT